MDYKQTIFLPKTSFPMKANLNELEPKIIEFWESKKIYERALSMKKEIFTVHDGPPYANGHIHLGHALNKVIKDITVKFSLLDGKKAVFIPGWDCHGLPIEKEVEKKLGKGKDTAEIRRESRKYAEYFVNIQMNEFKRLGVFAMWQKPYITMSPDYETVIVDSINEIWKKGRIYSYEKPVFWCPQCVTALAEAEVEYKTKKSPSIYVEFPAKFDELDGMKIKNMRAIVWTTTPWTIPGNFALAFHPSIDYVVVRKGEKHFIVAKKLVKVVGECEVIHETKGTTFEGKIFSHPIFPRDSIGVLADFVSDEEGTGIVHIAPGHGEEDFSVGRKYQLSVTSVLDEIGKGNEHSGYEGIFYEEMNSLVVNDLKERGFLLSAEGWYEHSYPHCWRCKKPVVFRATRQWFIKVEDIKNKFLNEVKKVEWIPEWGNIRMESTLASRPDWCISRQRAWGVPIPFVVCKNCGEYIWSEFASNKIKEDIMRGEPDSWWEKDVSYFLPEGISCPKCGGKEFRKGSDILDVWIDSGLSFRYMKENRSEEFSFPAHLYIEGTDQHRGWFQSSLILSFLLEGRAPYKSVFTHGFILDEFKRKMSKSLGNVVSPEDIVKENGAEVVRIWSVFSDPTEDVKVSEKILSEVVDIYRKIRNTVRFMLGVLGDNPVVEPQKLHPLDIYILTELRDLEIDVIKNYRKMMYHKVLRGLYSFADRTLSALYLDIIKDTIYCDSKKSPRRKSTQYTVFRILLSFLILSAPILSFLAEEAYSHLPEVFGYKKKESVFFEEFQNILISSNMKFDNEEKIKKFFSMAENIREKINEISDIMKKNGKIRSSLELRVKVKFPHMLDNTPSLLEEFFIVSHVDVDNSDEPALISVEKFEGAKKCPRCWKYFEMIERTMKFPDLCPRCEDVLSEQNLL